MTCQTKNPATTIQKNMTRQEARALVTKIVRDSVNSIGTAKEWAAGSAAIDHVSQISHFPGDAPPQTLLPKVAEHMSNVRDVAATVTEKLAAAGVAIDHACCSRRFRSTLISRPEILTLWPAAVMNHTLPNSLWADDDE